MHINFQDNVSLIKGKKMSQTSKCKLTKNCRTECQNQWSFIKTFRKTAESSLRLEKRRSFKWIIAKIAMYNYLLGMYSSSKN